MRIGILYICTGKYSVFWKGFYNSMEKYFIIDAKKHYFVFTDEENLIYRDRANVSRISIKKEGWPSDTLKRFDLFCSIEDLLIDMDYLFFFNANLKCVTEISCTEVLPNIAKGEALVAVIHPGLMKRKLKYCPYERKRKSSAYVPYNCGHVYVQGCLSGGTREAYLSMAKKLEHNIEKDKENGIVAIFHDESHLNRYIIGRNDIKYLSPAYCMPEDFNMPFETKILSLEKSKYFDVNILKSVKKDNVVSLSFRRIKKLFMCNIGYIFDVILKKSV